MITFDNTYRLYKDITLKPVVSRLNPKTQVFLVLNPKLGERKQLIDVETYLSGLKPGFGMLHDSLIANNEASNPTPTSYKMSHGEVKTYFYNTHKHLIESLSVLSGAFLYLK